MDIPTLAGGVQRHAALAVFMSAALALGGCAGFSRDGGFAPVADSSQQRLGKQIRWARIPAERASIDQRVAELLQQPLTADDAVQIALLNNRALQASFDELGVSEADLVQSGRLPNPRFTYSHAGAGGLYTIEAAITFNVLALVTAPKIHDIEKRRFAQLQSSIVIDVVQLADRTRRAYFTALAARETVRYMQQVRDAAQAGSELARRMLAAGNWNRLDQAREQSFYSDAWQSLERAQLAETMAREMLTRLMGLADGQPALRLAERLPDLPSDIDAARDIETIALQTRIDLQMMRAQMDAQARSLGLTQETRFVNVFELGPARILDGPRSDPYESGYELTLEIPLFDAGSPRLKKAQALYAQSVDRFAQAAVDARSQVRAAYARYRVTFELARHQRDAVLPIAAMVAEQDLLNYNAARLSVFDLLADARARIAGINDYIQGVRDFWIAKSQLDTALLSNPTH
jgi:outer membrane protein TolC